MVESPTRRWRQWYLFAVVLVTGAAVMNLELLGTRVMSPLYGSGMYVWASLITVTLVALAAGYWIGGSFADGFPRQEALFGILLLAAIFTLLVAVIARPVLAATAFWDLRWGCISSAFAIFTAPLLLLGMITPLAVRLKAQDVRTTGRAVGRIYAMSTVGSVAGTLVTGFVLLPSLTIQSILQVVAGSLAALAVLGWLLGRAWSAAAGAAAVAGAALFATVAWTGPDRGSPGVVCESQSLYGQLKVVDRDGERYLIIDGVCETHTPIDPALPLTCEYVRTFDLLPLCRPDARDVLIVGLGGGGILRLFECRGYAVDVVDIHPQLEQVARQYFCALRRGEEFHLADGRRFVHAARRKYDFIIVDVPTIDAFPFHLFSRESFSAMRAILKPSGILAVNAIACLQGAKAIGALSIQRTLAAVFPRVECFSAHLDPESRMGNVIFFASASGLTLPADALEGEICQRRIALPGEGGLLITDDYNPLDFLFAATSTGYRQRRYLGFDLDTMLRLK